MRNPQVWLSPVATAVYPDAGGVVVVVVAVGWVVITDIGVLCSQLPTRAVVGNMRARGSRFPL